MVQANRLILLTIAFSGKGNLYRLKGYPFNVNCPEAWFASDCATLDEVRPLCNYIRR